MRQFTGGYNGAALGKRWATDRIIARQVKTIQAVTPARRPTSRPSGRRQRSAVHRGRLDRIRELAPPGVVCVADAGLGWGALHSPMGDPGQVWARPHPANASQAVDATEANETSPNTLTNSAL